MLHTLRRFLSNLLGLTDPLPAPGFVEAWGYGFCAVPL